MPPDAVKRKIGSFFTSSAGLSAVLFGYSLWSIRSSIPFCSKHRFTSSAQAERHFMSCSSLFQRSEIGFCLPYLVLFGYLWTIDRRVTNLMFVYIFESKIQKCRKQAILERLRRGLVCLSYHVLTKPAENAGFCMNVQEVILSFSSFMVLQIKKAHLCIFIRKIL